ncbi:diguanylate cyclase [Aureimonas phyllosphaerae]|uniref:diguanylate cyclase n=1 Tax=Aureimonas phyllosphaerae TaxID=1166078 RepID=A0A7W6BWS7_9HYPH|nr:diguanylate cyclase [Aureimonas phyllosphaerae]MBB3937820.1 diguanylate cyclase (GGDEF)-like protein/PAS domain S-box-containing protein [Aureimonas phyllosphaerae]MBB3961849.1 diguanylate cyclase (GGDEF)-like protein/PAS domain S-box-containing protein [Aureimonas phyllosphaerae]
MMNVLRNIGVRARLLLLIAAAMLPLIGLIVTGLVISYRDTEYEAHRNVANEARLGASKIAHIFDDAQEFLATLRHMPQVLEAQQPTCNTLLAGLKAERAQLLSIGVIAPDRTILCHSRGVTGSLFHDEDLFEQTINSRGNRFVVGDFLVSPITGRPTIAVAMRLPPTAGRASGGVIFASLNLPMVERDVQLLAEESGHSWMIVQPRASRIILGWPHAVEFGTVTPGFELFPVMRAGRTGRTAAVRDLGGQSMIYGFEPIPNASTGDLWLAVGIPPSEVFAKVERRLNWTLLASAGALILALGGTALIAYWMQLRPIALLSRSAQRIGAGNFDVRTGMGQWQAPEFRRLGQLVDRAALTLAQAKAAEEAVAAGQRRFQLVADNTVDMITCVNAEGKRTLVTGASRRLLGYEPSELMGLSPIELAVEEDRAIVRSLLDTCRLGGEVSGARYRVRRKDGVVIWVELSGRPIDEIGGCVVSMRDVDQRQRTEEALAEATRQLELLAATDELTRLANRRTFNRRLEEAFAQTGDGGDFSLLLLDVDHFKAFNDRYGHPAGDRCLKAVSETLAACVRRDDEIGARYGGEELALILPGVGPSEALQRADAIRRAIAALAIPHKDAAGGTLTVSIGVASRSELRTGHPGPTEIIQKADEALYAAKAGGRNQVRALAA